MKEHFVAYLKKYKLLWLLNIIMLLGAMFSIAFGDLYIIERGVFSYNLTAIYYFFVIPVYSLVYGCFSYTIYKKIQFAQIPLVICSFLALLIELVFADTVVSWSIVSFVLLLVYVALCAFGSLLIKMVYAFKNIND